MHPIGVNCRAPALAIAAIALQKNGKRFGGVRLPSTTHCEGYSAIDCVHSLFVRIREAHRVCIISRLLPTTIATMLFGWCACEMMTAFRVRGYL